MPQLNPAPWLFIFTTSWFILLLIFKQKTLASNHMNKPLMPSLTSQQTTPWTWPWT